MSDGYATTAPLRSRIAIHAYGTNPVPWYDFVRALLPAGSVVDVGAGTGALWPPGTRDVVAVDYSAAMCAALRERGLPVVRGSGDALPFRDGAFDGAVCAHVLYHLPDPRRGLAELRRVARGWVAVATNGTGHMREIGGAEMHDRFPAERLREALDEFFADVTLHPYEDTLEVTSAGPVRAYAESIGMPAPPDLDERIATEGAYRIAKHTVLAIAR